MNKRGRGEQRRSGRAVILAVLCAGLLGLCARAAAPDLSIAGFRDQVGSAQRLVEACAGSAGACKPGEAPRDAHVAASGDRPAFGADWGWLRQAVTSAQKAAAPKRAEAMRAAQGRLAELAIEAGPATGGAKGAVGFKTARRDADAILARGEFQQDEGPGWLDREVAKLEDWLQNAFTRMEKVGSANPWLAPLIEWTCFGAAAGALLFFVRRSLARQSLQISLSEAATAQRGGRDATDWAKLADDRAAEQNWREAVHCLYWAAIASLEARHAWRPNPTRTPREYLRLLRPGSDVQRNLRGLTAQFERAWYGNLSLTEADFRTAQASFAGIRAADLRSAGADDRRLANGAAAAVAG